MKVKILSRVHGKHGSGGVIAMTEQWCIYQDGNGEQFAERWEDIVLEHDGPEKRHSRITEKEI